MSPAVLALLGFISLFGLMALRVPIAFCFGIVGFVGSWLMVGLGAALGNLGVVSWSSTTNYTLMALPLFVFMGHCVNQAGIARSLYETAYKWFGGVRGGLGIATIIACSGFAAVSGSSFASATTMGLISYPEMKRYGYSSKLAAGTIASAGTLAILIPPSSGFIVYSVLTEASVGRLFAAGILPGLLLAALFVLTIVIQVALQPSLAPVVSSASFTWKERIASLWGGVWAVLLLFSLVMGGIYLGVFTATEAAAVGAGGAFFIALGQRKLGWEDLKKIVLGTARTTAMVFFLVIDALAFNYFLAITRVPAGIAQWVVSLPVSPTVLLICILLIYIPLGCLMETLAMLLLTIPLFLPTFMGIGVDPIWLGVLLVILMELGQITPPVGLVVIALQGSVSDLTLGEAFAGSVPFIFADLVCLALIFIFPQLALFLPSRMF